MTSLVSSFSGLSIISQNHLEQVCLMSGASSQTHNVHQVNRSAVKAGLQLRKDNVQLPTLLKRLPKGSLPAVDAPKRGSDEFWRSLFGLSDSLTVNTKSSLQECTSPKEQRKSARHVAVRAVSASTDVSEEAIRNEDWRAVRFTAEKARILREKLRGSETWHDTMYHSGIASRLAES